MNNDDVQVFAALVWRLADCFQRCPEEFSKRLESVRASHWKLKKSEIPIWLHNAYATLASPYACAYRAEEIRAPAILKMKQWGERYFILAK